MTRTLPLSLATAALFAVAATSNAAEHVVTQQKGAFSVPVVKGKVGDEVAFRNDDTVFHNVFSLSESQPFDLGSYGQGQVRKVKLAKPGKIEVECAIHPGMTMVIDVSK